MPPNKFRKFAEAHLCNFRIAELRNSPVNGSFDLKHLCEINRRIFQDLPNIGFPDVTPGQLRKAAEAGRDWIKRRDLGPDLPGTTVAYSRMDERAIAQLNIALERANPAKLSYLDFTDFTMEMADIYTQLDYAHPFSDGNSRTLRVFTEQLAEESGYKINWSRFATSEVGRNVLYIARDRSVNELALPHVVGADTKRELVFMLDQFEGNRNLQELLPDAITKEKSPAKNMASIEERLRDPATAVKDPQLKGALSKLALMEATLRAADVPETERQKAADVLRREMARNIAAGKIYPVEKLPNVTKEQIQEARDKADKQIQAEKTNAPQQQNLDFTRNHNIDREQAKDKDRDRTR